MKLLAKTWTKCHWEFIPKYASLKSMKQCCIETYHHLLRMHLFNFHILCDLGGHCKGKSLFGRNNVAWKPITTSWECISLISTSFVTWALQREIPIWKGTSQRNILYAFPTKRREGLGDIPGWFWGHLDTSFPNLHSCLVL